MLWCLEFDTSLIMDRNDIPEVVLKDALALAGILPAESSSSNQGVTLYESRLALEAFVVASYPNISNTDTVSANASNNNAQGMGGSKHKSKSTSTPPVSPEADIVMGDGTGTR
jgi:hypothetical protein